MPNDPVTIKISDKMTSKLAGMIKDVTPNKKVSAVLGAIVADVASLPLEWIYKDDKMKVLIN